MRVVPFTPAHSDRWDEIAERAPMGTFLHTRRFLSYHGERFRDASVLVTDDDDTPRWIRLTPCALSAIPDPPTADSSTTAGSTRTVSVLRLRQSAPTSASQG